MDIGQITRVADHIPVWHIIMMAVTLLAALPTVLLVIIMRRFFVRGLTESEK